jgi:two-component system nitrate/nitrite response regulator NarL
MEDDMRLLFVHESRLTRDAIAMIMGVNGTVDVTTTGHPNEAYSLIQKDNSFDLVLLGCTSSGFSVVNDFANLRKISNMSGGQRVVVLLEKSSDALLKRVQAHGAIGSVSYEMSSAILYRSLIDMASEELEPNIQKGVNDTFSLVRTRLNMLTPREIEMLEGLCLGQSNKVIASRLSISVPTVKFHMKSLYRKLEVKNRTQAALYAFESCLF